MDAFRDLYSREPARINGLVVSLLVALAGVLGVALDQTTAATIVGILAALVTAEATRHVVASPETASELALADPVTDSVADGPDYELDDTPPKPKRK